MERPPKTSLASDLSLWLVKADAGSEPATATQVTAGQAPTQNPKNDRGADDLETKLSKARQTIAEAEERQARLK